MKKIDFTYFTMCLIIHKVKKGDKRRKRKWAKLSFEQIFSNFHNYHYACVLFLLPTVEK